MQQPPISSQWSTAKGGNPRLPTHRPFPLFSFGTNKKRSCFRSNSFFSFSIGGIMRIRTVDLIDVSDAL